MKKIQITKIKTYILKHKIKTILLPIILIIMIIGIGIGTKLFINWNNKLIIDKNSLKIIDQKPNTTNLIKYISIKKYNNLSKYRWIDFNNYSINYSYKWENFPTTIKTDTKYYLAKRQKINLIKKSFEIHEIMIITIELENYNQGKDSGNIEITFEIYWGYYISAKLLFLNIELDK